MKRGRAFAGKGHLRLKAGCLDLRTDSLVFFFPEKAFLIKKSALLTTICCENIQIVSTYGKKQFTGGWAGIADKCIKGFLNSTTSSAQIALFCL